MNDARRGQPDEQRSPAPRQPDPVDEGPPEDRRPVRGPQWARKYRGAVEEEPEEGARSIRTTDHGGAD